MRDRIIALVICLTFAACASLTSPTGGPKDLKPPRLIESKPDSNGINFKGKSVELTFNETVKLNNAREEIIISPSPGKETEIVAKNNRVVITPKNGWKDTTTYSIQFREGIQDITESNSPLNLKLAFSTGPKIDSLHISGRAANLLTGMHEKNVTIAIYNQDTFDIFKHTPSYFTKANKNGRFKLENIKQGSYHIYTFDDKNKNLKVDSRNEKFGFLAKNVQLTDNIDSLVLTMVQVDSRPLRFTSIRNIGDITRLRFNKFVDTYSVKSPVDITHHYSDTQEEIVLWNPDGDSIQIEVSAMDSIGQKKDSTFFIKKAPSKVKPDPLRWSLGKPTIEMETAKFTTILSFNKPILDINFDSLSIELDTINRVFFTKNDLTIDQIHKQFTLTRQLDKKALLQYKNLTPSLQAGIGFIHSIQNDTSKRLSTRISVFQPESTGILTVNITPGKGQYFVELIQNGKVEQRIANTPRITFKSLVPGDYQLRLVIDANNNGRWDPGNFYRNEEPEKIIYYRSETKKMAIPIKANWEVGPLLLRF